MKTKNYKGITLIALIITIIVLLILAGVSISLVVGDNGVLGQAVNATTATDIAETKEAIELALIGYYDENGKYTTADVAKAVLDAGATLGEDGITVTTAKGNTVDITELVEGASDYSSKVWYINDDGYVTDGDVEVAIGDYVNYTPSTSETYPSYSTANGSSDQTFSSSDYTGTWRVIGVEDGKILLVSTGTVGTLSLYGQLGYQNGVSELNNICAIYGTGDYASSARSLTMEDIATLAGYDPSDTDGEGTLFGDDYIFEYGIDVTYTYDGSSTVTAEGSNGVTVSSTNHSSGFTYYDESSGEFKTLTSAGSVTLKNTSYNIAFARAQSYSYWMNSGFYGAGNTNDVIESIVEISSNYWLGNKGFSQVDGYATLYYNVAYVYSGDTVAFGAGSYGSYCLVRSYGYSRSISWGVRAAVSLKSGISLTSAGSNTWNISE